MFMKDFVLKLARKAVENYVRTGKRIPVPEKYPEEMKEKRGVFVTLHKKGGLRGCIGLPYPDKPLVEGLIEAACLVCRDPRFPPLQKDELKDIKIEVSVLTEPEPFKAKDIHKIEIGKHGLIIRSGLQGALFLPQVPVEQDWNMEEYMQNLCLKACLPPDSWSEPGSKLYRFEAEVFSEGI
jgi:uncharacterized protein (TIGR00296 family)